jgi:hypothetical protein
MPNYAEEEAWSVGNWEVEGGSKNHKNNTVTKTKLTHVNVTDC